MDTKLPVQRKLSDFFGVGAAYVKGQKMTISDIDEAIAEAIKDNLRL